MSERCKTCGSMDGVPLWKHPDDTLVDYHVWHSQDASPPHSRGSCEYMGCHPCPVCSANPEAKETLTLEEITAHLAVCKATIPELSPPEDRVPWLMAEQALETAEAALLHEAELREALKPFAEALRYIENSDAPETDEIPMRFTVAQFERAAQALARKP